MNATTATVILGAIALISLTATVLLVTASFRQALANALRTSERLDQRHQAHMDTILDRLMAIKWEDYAAIRTLDEDVAGGFYPPVRETDDDTAVLEVVGPKWGHLSTMNERAKALSEEATLIDEDFDEEGSPRRSAE